MSGPEANNRRVEKWRPPYEQGQKVQVYRKFDSPRGVEEILAYEGTIVGVSQKLRYHKPLRGLWSIEVTFMTTNNNPQTVYFEWHAARGGPIAFGKTVQGGKFRPYNKSGSIYWIGQSTPPDYLPF